MYNFVKSNQQKLFTKKTDVKELSADAKEGTVATKDGLDNIYRIFRYSGVNRIFEENKASFYIWSFFLHGLDTILLPVTFFASYFMSSNKNLDYGTLFTSIQVFYNVISSSAKIISLTILVPQLIGAEAVMAKLDARCVAKDEVDLVIRTKKFCRKIVVGFTIIYMSYSTSTFLCSVIMGHPPYSIYLPRINWRNSRNEFLVASFIEWILMSGACLQQVANDSYGPVYINVLRGHMNILCLRIRKLCTNPEKTLEENYTELKMCIRDHKYILELYDIVTPVISTTIFIQFTITAATLGTTLINLLIFATSPSAVIASVIYIFAVCMQIFPCCYFCNCLIFDNEELANEIFHSSWINQIPSYRKMLVFFLQRVQQPMILTAGKIYPINLNSFISIAKFSFSLYTLIKAMDIKGRLGMQ